MNFTMPGVAAMLRYAITTADCDAADCARWRALGVDYVQLRDKRLSAGELAGHARRLLDQLDPSIRLLVPSRVDVALATGVAGVHLTAHPEELTPAEVRRVFALAGAPRPRISISCHTLEEVRRAHAAAADLILFGPVFEKRVAGERVAPGLGLAALEAACSAAQDTPVLALGGITHANIAACLAAGAGGIAAIRLFAASLQHSP